MNVVKSKWVLSLAIPMLMGSSAFAQGSGAAGSSDAAAPGNAGAGIATIQDRNAQLLLERMAVQPQGVYSITQSGQQPTANWYATNGDWVRWSNKRSEDLGATLVPVDAALRAQLGFGAEQGLVVTEVQPDGRAARVGLKANDILLSLADQPLGKPEDVLKSLKGWSQKHPSDACELKILRVGKPTALKVKGETYVFIAPATEPAAKVDFFIGTPANLLDETFRAHLDVPQGTGLIVGEVTEGTPAEKAGIKQGDILLSFENQPLPDVETLRNKIQAKGSHPAELELLRAGKRIRLSVTPEARKAEVALEGATATQFLTSGAFDQAQRLASFDLIRSLPLGDRVEAVNAANANNLNLTDSKRALLWASSATQADLNKKIDDLTAQVQALTKAVESLRAAQAHGEKK